MVKEKLDCGFVNIMKKHMNPVWALDELEYLVWTVHEAEFYQLSEFDQAEVKGYLLALKLLYK